MSDLRRVIELCSHIQPKLEVEAVSRFVLIDLATAMLLAASQAEHALRDGDPSLQARHIDDKRVLLAIQEIRADLEGDGARLTLTDLRERVDRAYLALTGLCEALSPLRSAR